MYIKSIIVSLHQKQKQIDMKLTKKQQELFETLVRLGDSKELALKTVLEQEKKEESEMYYQAYNL